MGSEDYEKALRSLNFALAIKKDHFYGWLLKGNCQFALGRYEDALRSLNRALALNDANFQAWYSKGLLLSELGKQREAIYSLDRALRLKKNDFNLWYLRGYGLIELKEYQKAIASLKRAVALNPADPDAWYYLAFSQSCLGRNREALLAYDQAIKNDPGNIDLICYQGLALCELGRFKEAERLFERVLEKDPEHILALVNLSERYLVSGKLTKGIRAAKKALKAKDSEFKIISGYLVLTGYFLEGKNQKALAELRILMEFIKGLGDQAKVTDWNFSPLVDVIKKNLSQPSRKIVLSLIGMLRGKLKLNSFEKLIRDLD